jgi:hypothetical protein
MPAAIRPYSMAVAAFSSLRNLMTKRMNGVLRQRSPTTYLLFRKSYERITAISKRGQYHEDA